MRASWMIAAAAAAVVLAVLPGAAAEVDEVIARHVEARGGRENWQAIETMRMSGSYTAFSKVAPFTLERKRGDRYHLDTMMNEHTVRIGYDGESAWQENHFLQEGAQPIAGVDLVALMADVHLATPLFDYEDRGFEARLLGSVEVEGMQAVGIELTRPDGSAETWYLDPATHLEIARDAPGSDFGDPVEMRTFYDDFREVGGVKLPHLIETQWYTRHRVMEIDRVEINPTIDDELFRMPPPPGMAPLRSLAGNWKVAVSSRSQPGAPWQESEREATVAALVRGALLQESATSAEGNEVVWTLSYDKFREHYVFTEINDVTTYLDRQHGAFDEEGKLVVSNAETGTPWNGYGRTFHSRVSFVDITDDGFRVESEVSVDGGENWFLAVKESYTRSAE